MNTIRPLSNILFRSFLATLTCIPRYPWMPVPGVTHEGHRQREQLEPTQPRHGRRNTDYDQLGQRPTGEEIVVHPEKHDDHAAREE